PITSGLQPLRTAGSSAALRLISGPMPAGSPMAIAIIALSLMGTPACLYRWHRANAREAFLLPRQQRRLDHIRNALAADRPDREIHGLEPEPVGRDLLQGEALRGELLKRQLAGLEAVAARALDGDEFNRDLFEREIGELLHLALDHNGAALAF